MYDFKKDFPLFKDRDVIYLDNAATAQKPACVIEAEKEFYEKQGYQPYGEIGFEEGCPHIWMYKIPSEEKD